MIWGALGLILLAIAGSAFFSGAETGFYRATRLRLVIDALAGKRSARGLLWLSAHPGLFVAVTLVGTNMTHDLASLAMILAAEQLVELSPEAVTFVGPLLLAPVLFVLGELAPKSLFLDAPNRLLRRIGPLLLLAAAALLPIAALLWALSRLVVRLLGQSSHEVQQALERLQLRQVFEEGHEAGVLRPTQRALAQGVFAAAQEPLRRFLTPLARLPRVRPSLSRAEALRLADREGTPALLVEESDASGSRLTGYVTVVELALSRSAELGPLRALPKFPAATTQLDALIRLQSAQEELAAVIDRRGAVLGIVFVEQLREALFQGE